MIPYKCKKGECGTCKVMIDGHWTQACQTKIPALGKGEVFQVNIREVGFDAVTLDRARTSSPRPLFGLLPGSMRASWLMTNGSGVFFTSARCPPALLHVGLHAFEREHDRPLSRARRRRDSIRQPHSAMGS